MNICLHWTHFYTVLTRPKPLIRLHVNSSLMVGTLFSYYLLVNLWWLAMHELAYVHILLHFGCASTSHFERCCTAACADPYYTVFV